MPNEPINSGQPNRMNLTVLWDFVGGLRKGGVDVATMADIPVFTSKQDTLVSGVNIKTINSVSLLGSGDIVTTGISEALAIAYSVIL